MAIAPTERVVLGRLHAHLSDTPQVRVAVLTSSRARPGAPVDQLSDYDVILGLTDLAIVSDAWLAGIGEPLIVIRDPGDGLGLSCMVLFADGAKIDFTLTPVAALAALAAAPALPDELNRGYRILLDRDEVTAAWPPVTGTGYLPHPPTEQEFRGIVDEVWFCASYVAKYLWRQEFLPARVIFDQEIKYLLLLKLFGWRIGLDTGWTARSGFFGRGMHRLLPAPVWSEFRATYTGPEPAASWAALWRLLALFSQVARGVARDLGFVYPETLEATMRRYLHRIEKLPPPDVRSPGGIAPASK